jgi:hypothetical protein
MNESALHRNPFWFLSATPLDDRKRIIELVDQKSMEPDHAEFQRAGSELTNPRKRLAVEMAWLPGVPAKKAQDLARKVLRDYRSLRDELDLPPLAYANLMAAAFESVVENDPPEVVADFIYEIASFADVIVAEDVLHDINADRVLSGFPEVRGTEQVEAELAERKRYFCTVINNGLNRMPFSDLVEAVTIVIDGATEGGEYQGLGLIDDVVDRYEVDTQGVLQKEEVKVRKVIQTIRDSVPIGERMVSSLIQSLETTCRKWSEIAQPILLSAKARGIEHGPSCDLAFSIRSLGIDLFNKHNMFIQSKRIIKLLQELFPLLPEICERVRGDVQALAKIIRKRKEAEVDDNEPIAEMFFFGDDVSPFEDPFEGEDIKQMCDKNDSDSDADANSLRWGSNVIINGVKGFEDDYGEELSWQINQVSEFCYSNRGFFEEYGEEFIFLIFKIARKVAMSRYQITTKSELLNLIGEVSPEVIEDYGENFAFQLGCFFIKTVDADVPF